MLPLTQGLRFSLQLILGVSILAAGRAASLNQSPLNNTSAIAEIEVYWSASSYFEKAINSHDQGEITRAFNGWESDWKTSNVVPLLKDYLNNPDPFVRYNASEQLFRVGDTTGYWVLLAMVRSSTPFFVLGRDLRIWAASTLGKYGETDATAAIINLYKATNDRELITPISNLNMAEAARINPNEINYKDRNWLIFLGKMKDRSLVPNFEATFNTTSKPEVKVAAAWALAMDANDPNAIDYLVNEAEAGLHPSGAVSDLNEREVIRCLGTIQDPKAKRALEDALDFPARDPSVRQIAIANLIFNQGGSPKAVQAIVDQLNDPGHAKLSWDFALNIAAQLTNDSAIAEAGNAFARNDAAKSWVTYTVDRRNWSIYNWIRDYVILLNNPPTIPGHGTPIGWLRPLPAEPDDPKIGDPITDQDVAKFYGGVTPLFTDIIEGDPELSMVVRHPDGVPWVNAPVSFHVTSGSRLISTTPGKGPYLEKVFVRTDSHGVARAYLQPLPSQ